MATSKTIAGISYRNDLFLISGPCSVETEEQTHSTIDQLAALGSVNLVRGGIWKPRTRPNQFEGIGAKGLKWLVDAGKKYHLPVTTEVASTSHVEQALKAGVDVLWLGARTTVNPFLVQEIAECLRGVGIGIMVKNPINPDVELWIGAIERVRGVGIESIAAIHRGFTPFEKTIYRNVPNWQIPIQLKSKMPEIPIICDPSHICGRRDILPLVAQKAMDLAMDGLMIESHIFPDEAWSDAAQQVTPDQLKNLITDLVVRTPETVDQMALENMELLRNQIDQIDEKILNMYAQRMKIVQEIGVIKKQNDVTIFQLERWKEITEIRKELANSLGLTDAFVDHLLQLMHKESIHQQNTVMNDDENSFLT